MTSGGKFELICVMLRMGLVLLSMGSFMVPSFAFAQDGGISGTVTDFGGGALPGVTVEVSGSTLAGPQVAVTDRRGSFAFTELPPGNYLVAFSLAGFERLERGVELTAGGALTVDAELQLGGLFEEVTVSVTGSAIEAPAINMPHAVTVVSRETLEQQGSTQLVDLFRSLTVSHGVVGERNSWYNSNQPATVTENVANVNLRGLGASRTLVLINGRRQVPVPARLIGGRFVDVNTIPSIAVGRLEVLKEGAAATYGSDAVGGVANFVTRSDFRGFEINVAHDYFDGGGDTAVAGIWAPTSVPPASSSPWSAWGARSCRWRSGPGRSSASAPTTRGPVRAGRAWATREPSRWARRRHGPPMSSIPAAPISAVWTKVDLPVPLRAVRQSN